MTIDKKPENVKIIQMSIEPFTYYVSNGSMYKDKCNSHNIFGLGDDQNVYRYGEHKYLFKDKFGSYENFVGWITYIP